MSDQSASSPLDRARSCGEALLRGERIAIVSRRCARVAAVLSAAIVVGEVVSIARVIGSDGSVAPQAQAPRVPSPSLERDYRSLAETHLFGQAVPVHAAPRAEAAPAPDTDLPLTLTGVLVVDGDGPSVAIVASSGSGAGRKNSAPRSRRVIRT